MYTSETKLFFVFSILAFLLAIGAAGGVGYLVWQKDLAYEERLAARALRIATEKEAKSLGHLAEETAADRKELSGYILTEDTVVDFLSMIGTLGRAKGVTTETRSLAVESIEGSDTFEYLTLEVGVLGSFSSVVEMLSLLETVPYQVQVRSAAVDRASDIQGAILWRGAYRLSVTKYK